jgi:2,3-dihydroxybiphenyl 1,2-dioxygenase
MDILGIAYLGFESPNAKAWTEFGPEVLGLGLGAAGDDETVHMRMDDRRWRIAFHHGETDRLAYIGWELRYKPSWQAAIATLEDNGFDVVLGDADLAERRGVREVAQFTDPAGYQHELVYGQRYDPGSFIPGRRHHGFVADRDGVGHVVLVVPEFPESLDHFWQDVMGFEWFGAGAGPFKAGFYRAKLNGLTHNLGLVEGPGMSGIHHIGMPVRNVDDVGIALDLCKQRDVPLQRLLGRHTQDPVISFYTFTPAGFIIEYLSPVVDNDVDAFYETNPETLSVWGHEMVGPPLPATVKPVAAA